MRLSRMLTFEYEGKKYRANSALEIVRALQSDSARYPNCEQSVRGFLRWSLQELHDHLPPRDLELSDRLDDNELALSYLYLRDEYGAGKLSAGKTNANGSRYSKTSDTGHDCHEPRGRV